MRRNHRDIMINYPYTEVITTLCMGCPDIVSFGDLAILRGMCMLYRHRKINRPKKKISVFLKLLNREGKRFLSDTE